MRHKHADIIHAWAEGAEIEYFSGGNWYPSFTPKFTEARQYRLRPQPKPDIVMYANVYDDGFLGDAHSSKEKAVSNRNITSIGLIQFSISGETGKLKSVEIVEE